jgi:hypothetical protein
MVQWGQTGARVVFIPSIKPVQAQPVQRPIGPIGSIKKYFKKTTVLPSSHASLTMPAQQHAAINCPRCAMGLSLRSSINNPLSTLRPCLRPTPV